MAARAGHARSLERFPLGCSRSDERSVIRHVRAVGLRLRLTRPTRLHIMVNRARRRGLTRRFHQNCKIGSRAARRAALFCVRRLEQITMLCSPSTSGALRLTLRTNGLPFVLSVAERSRSMNAGSRPTGLQLIVNRSSGIRKGGWCRRGTPSPSIVERSREGIGILSTTPVATLFLCRYRASRQTCEIPGFSPGWSYLAVRRACFFISSLLC